MFVIELDENSQRFAQYIQKITYRVQHHSISSLCLSKYHAMKTYGGVDQIII
jgi:hypothetical protein